MAIKGNNKPKLTMEQLSSQEQQAVGNLFQFMRKLQLEGKIGRK